MIFNFCLSKEIAHIVAINEGMLETAQTQMFTFSRLMRETNERLHALKRTEK